MNSAEFDALPYESLRSDLFHAITTLVLEGAAPDEIRILVSHHFWQADQACYVVRVSSLVTSVPDLLAGRTRGDWQTLYDTTPCMPLDRHTNHKFMGHQSGGRMIQLDPQHILLSVGDFAFDGFNAELKASQDMSMAYGKTIEIDLRTGTGRVFTSGHRNAQGLHLDAQGRIWLTEHGPKGGDELNLIHEGNNYGWPLVTLGAEYESFSWPGSESSALHPEFTGPSFAWTPSIATSNLTSVEGGDFERWQGDLIVSTLIARSLYRVHFEQDEPVLAEPIPVGERVRDIVRDSRGRIVFWTDRAAIGILARAAEDS
jgi:glucose/arabinose dehydrogenase